MDYDRDLLFANHDSFPTRDEALSWVVDVAEVLGYPPGEDIGQFLTFVHLPDEQQRRFLPLLHNRAYAEAVKDVAGPSWFSGHPQRALFSRVALLTLAQAALSPLEGRLVSIIAPADRRGLHQGVLGTTYSVSFGIGPVAGLFAFDQLSPSAPMLLAVPVTAVSSDHYCPDVCALWTSELGLGRRSWGGTPAVCPDRLRRRQASSPPT